MNQLVKPDIEHPSEASDFRVTPVILSGGTGSRLWPVSRASFPKQFWPLVTERSLIQDTALRSLGAGFAEPIVVCNEEHRFLVAEQLRSIGISDGTILLEPFGRNSAPAITAAALLAAEDDPETVLWMMAADAAIQDNAALRVALSAAYKAAKAGYVVTFGIKPTAPETGYGYIEVGPELAKLPGACRVNRFLEKPERAGASAMLEAGGYLWNSGMFVFTAKTVLDEMQTHAPDVLAAVRKALSGRKADLEFVRLAKDAFAACPDISLDYAVAERTERAAVVPCDIGWSDVGSWSALWDMGNKDAAGNVVHGDALLEKAHDCYVRSDGMLTAVVGLKDAVIVTTEDAVLAMHRDHAQDVKKVVERLKAAKRPEGTTHNRCYRPWGFYESADLRRPFPGEAHRRAAREQALAAEAFPPRRALDRGGGHRARSPRRRGNPAARERERVPAAGQRPPAGKPRQDPAGADRGAGRGLIWARTISSASRIRTAAID